MLLNYYGGQILAAIIIFPENLWMQLNSASQRLFSTPLLYLAQKVGREEKVVQQLAVRV